MFKDKFTPTWEPRYVASPAAFSLPIIMAEVAMLTSAAPKTTTAAQAAE
jgi:lysylphosphatidylglycerol synthetase-like protein (DUF2156 family)